jgi:hypothetical protein
MTIIVQRSDMSRMYAAPEAEKARLFHFGLSTETTQKAELIVSIDNSKVFLLKADK